jgi:hypothetical protein
MPVTNVTLPDNTPVEVKLCADNQGVVSLGIRINGSNWNVLVSSLTMPAPGRCQPWGKTIKDIMNASPPSRFPL